MPPKRMQSASSMSRSWRLPGGVRRWNMAISDRDILSAPGTYLQRHPEEAALLSEPVLLLSRGGFRLTAELPDACDCRRAGPRRRGPACRAPRVRDRLQPGVLAPTWSRPMSHWPARRSANWWRRPVLTRARCSASRRPPCTSSTARSRHGRRGTSWTTSTSFGYAFATADGGVGRIQESEVRGAGWYPLAVAERRGGIELVSQGSRTRPVAVPPGCR